MPSVIAMIIALLALRKYESLHNSAYPCAEGGLWAVWHFTVDLIPCAVFVPSPSYFPCCFRVHRCPPCVKIYCLQKFPAFFTLSADTGGASAWATLSSRSGSCLDTFGGAPSPSSEAFLFLDGCLLIAPALTLPLFSSSRLLCDLVDMSFCAPLLLGLLLLLLFLPLRGSLALLCLCFRRLSAPHFCLLAAFPAPGWSPVAARPAHGQSTWGLDWAHCLQRCFHLLLQVPFWLPGHIAPVSF